MNKTNIHNKKYVITASIAIVVALALIASPIVSMDDAFATKKRKGNVAEQSISQSQSSVQNALCASGGTTFLSCNNVSFQNQKNTGNNALAQQGGNGKGGNSGEQSISQSQSSEQNSQVVSGGDTIGSGNNINVQNQENSGNNALAQQGGNGKGGNSGEQSISQSQSSEQNSQVVSGGDTIGSGNNVNVQSQTNSGSNAAAQS
ncbi:hypothetical protein [Candidatus Nitrosocosmicus sp. SS]|jgi:uncharacterized protein YdeI (BOF family)|uniref:hypothetical protein n=1 Tax=Candidatus Nitrosocosmicus agrestis TaxID=2563600 RepID=UPI00122E36EA|nr:hypothetical protein [Candidatus Nitrosocosmicus sp. SS]KAA2283729.1 hypothetical protein F1Z66_00100 [Candidatus Nitrosocosmicus sp. SS]KAF0870106.1 hypothetical protein E5N71_00825 [Candidatus Nitrosocosmicus sp. SS]